MKKPNLLWIIPLLAVQAAVAEPRLIAPGEVVKLTLAYSPLLKGFEEDVHAATARRLQAGAGLMPQLDARTQAYHYEGLENQALGPVSIPVIDDQFSASIGITQPLYTGGKVTQQKRSTRFGEAAAQQASQAASSDLILQTLTTYWQWSKALALTEAYRDAVARMNALANDTRNLEKAGLATDNDRLAVEVSLDQARLQLDDAERQAGVSRLELSRLTGRAFTEADAPEKPNPAASGLTLPVLNDALTHAFSNRHDLVSLRLSLQSRNALVEAARAEGRPQLALIARYEQGRPNQRDFPPDEQWRDDAVIGAAATWTLFDGGLTRARTAEALSRATREALQLQSTEDLATREVNTAHLNLRYALSRRQTTLHAEASARRNVEVSDTLWKAGTARHSDVLEAQSKLTASTAQRIAAEADVLVARAVMNHATGDLR